MTNMTSNLRWISAAFWLFGLCLEIEAKKKKKDPHKSLWSFLKVIGIVYLIVFIPLIVLFFYTLFRDPKTPDVLKGLWQWLKQKWASKLGEKHKDARKKKRRKKEKKKRAFRNINFIEEGIEVNRKSV